MIAFCCDTLPVLPSTQNITHKKAFFTVCSSFHTPCFNMCLLYPAYQLYVLSGCSPASVQPWNQLDKKQLFGNNGNCLYGLFFGLFFNIFISDRKLPGLLLVYLQGNAHKQSFQGGGKNSGHRIADPRECLP